MPLLGDDATRLQFLRRIEEHILRDTGNRFERLVLLDEEARPLLVKDGSGGDVYLTAEETATLVGRVHLVTHNHPRSTSFTDGDVLGAIGLGAQEINAFGPQIRYRFCRQIGGRGWPTQAVARAAMWEIDLELRDALRPSVLRGELSPLAAEALHRRLRCVRFARRFLGDVEYREERR